MQIWPFKPILKVGQGGIFPFLPERINCVQDETVLPIVRICPVFIQKSCFVDNDVGILA